jgi:hypothetical protein
MSFNDSNLSVCKLPTSTVGEVKLAWFIGNGRLLILCGSQAQQEKILKLEKLNGKKIKSRVLCSYARLRGVVTGVPVSKVPVKGLDTPTHSMVFLYFYYFLHFRIIVKT